MTIGATIALSFYDNGTSRMDPPTTCNAHIYWAIHAPLDCNVRPNEIEILFLKKGTGPSCRGPWRCVEAIEWGSCKGAHNL